MLLLFHVRNADAIAVTDAEVGVRVKLSTGRAAYVIARATVAAALHAGESTGMPDHARARATALTRIDTRC